MRATDTRALVCPNGHETFVYGWGTPPLACPHCEHGLPCRLPLRPSEPQH